MLTLCKNRAPDFNESVLLRTLDFNRHWFYFYNSPTKLKLNNCFIIFLLNLLKIEVDIPYDLKKIKFFGEELLLDIIILMKHPKQILYQK